MLSFLNLAWTKVTELPDLPSLTCLNMSTCTVDSIFEGHGDKAPISKLILSGATYADVSEAFLYVETSCLSFLVVSDVDNGILRDILHLGWLAIVLLEGAWCLDMGRLSLGYGIGLLSYVVPVYIAEITPKNLRGGFTAVNQLMICCGVSVMCLLGTVINWRILAVILVFEGTSGMDNKYTTVQFTEESTWRLWMPRIWESWMGKEGKGGCGVFGENRAGWLGSSQVYQNMEAS